MRLVFMDEAGTSPRHPVTVCAAVIIDADKALILAEMLLDEALAALPQELGDGYEFSAKDVWGNPAYNEFWRMADKIALLKAILRIPRHLGQAIAFSAIWDKAHGGYNTDEMAAKVGFSLSELDHFNAFLHCVGKADQVIRDKGAAAEIGMIVAEEHQLRRRLAIVPRMLRETPVRFGPGHLIPLVEEVEKGYGVQRGEVRVSRIRNTIHFVKKSEDKLVWIADACAWALRAYFQDTTDKFGFCEELLGSLPNPANFTGGGATSYWFGQ